MKTYSAKAGQIAQNWYLVDAAGQTLGRLSSRIARILRGKHKPIYTPGVDTGDYVVVINADKVRVTGNKASKKLYYRHSDYVGGLKTTTFQDLQVKHPGQVVYQAVRGMISRNPLGRVMLSKLKVYAGSEHPHVAQQPQLLEEVQ